MSYERFNLVKLGQDNKGWVDILPTGYETKKLHIDFEYVKQLINKNNYIPFENFSDYKYIIDCQSFHGPHKISHSGRLFWEFHMDRVLFIPIDGSKQWFECIDTAPVPYKHFIPYKYNDMETIVQDLKWLEYDLEAYERIRKNCREYSEKHLQLNNILQYVKETIT